jgi:hypothetical protein
MNYIIIIIITIYIFFKKQLFILFKTFIKGFILILYNNNIYIIKHLYKTS